MVEKVENKIRLGLLFQESKEDLAERVAKTEGGDCERSNVGGLGSCGISWVV